MDESDTGNREERGIDTGDVADEERETGPQTPDGRENRGGDGDASLGTRIGVVVLAALLTVSLIGFSGVVAAQATVLSAEYVTGTMDRQGVYGDMETAVEEGIINGTDGSTAEGALAANEKGVLTDSIREVVTTSYARQEAQTNVRQTYDYLHGRTDRLRLEADATPLVENLPEAVAGRIEEIPLAEFVQRPGVGGSVEEFGVDPETLGETIESEETFEKTQAEASEEFERSGRDRDEINQSLREETELGDVSPQVEQAVYDLQGTIVVAMTSDMSHDEYVSRMEQQRAEFALAVGEFTARQFEAEVGSSIDLTEGGIGVDEAQIRNARGPTGRADDALLVLPVLVVVFLAAILRVTRSVSRTARLFGASLLAAGMVGLLVSPLAGSRIRGAARTFTAGAEPFVRSTAVAAADGLMGQLAVGSILVLVLGAIFVGISYAIVRYEPEQIPPAWR